MFKINFLCYTSLRELQLLSKRRRHGINEIALLWSRNMSNFLSEGKSTNLVNLTDRMQTLYNGPIKNIRNFLICAHIDHGKSTLSDRLLELAGNISPLNKAQGQILDNLQVERERGITVKAQTATMFYRDLRDGQVYHLNLIDTPGHVDFSYEVSRSIAACQGAILLVDSSQGIQAQTIANYMLALEMNLEIIPVLSKIDLVHSDIESVKQQLSEVLDIDGENVISISGKTGLNVEQIFQAIVDRIPPPNGDPNAPFKALVFDSWFDTHRGVILLILIKDGYLTKGDRITAYHQNQKYEVQDLGLLLPMQTPVETLKCGQVGYVVCGIKSTREICLGETFFKSGAKKDALPISYENERQTFQPAGSLFNHGVLQHSMVDPLPGFKPAKSMIYAGLFPATSSDFELLAAAIDKLLLNDASVTVQRESSQALGLGFRCGFLGVLHLDVFCTRLDQEFDAPVIVSAPTVPYHAIMPDQSVQLIDSPTKMIKNINVDHYEEPIVLVSIVAPAENAGALIELCTKHRGSPVDSGLHYIAGSRILIKYKIPLSELLIDFYDHVKSISAGYASLEYDEAGYQTVDLVCLEMRINSEPVDALSVLCERQKATFIGRRISAKLKEVISRHQFEIIIQAAIGQKIVARERIMPYRKDVLIKGGKTVGGGDITRKKKLLEKQKEGKRRLKSVGSVELGDEVFTSVMRIR